MTEIVISSERELAEVIAQRFKDGVMLSIFIEEGSEKQDGEGSDEDED